MLGMQVSPIFPSFFRSPNQPRLLDRTGERYFHIASWWWGVILGYIIGLSTPSVGGRYVGMFLMASGYSGKSKLACKMTFDTAC